MKKVIIVSCTKSQNEPEFEKRPLGKTIKKFKQLYSLEQVSYKVIFNNKEGLSKVYNKFITEKYKDCIVLFVHDDVIIDTLFFYEHINKTPFTVTGLAGAKHFKSFTATENIIPAWHLMTEKESYSGEVKHIHNDRVFTTVFGKTFDTVKVIDGVFIAVNVEKLLPTNARFNENYSFHHYDIAFCLECLKEKISIGVMPINIIHYGLGDSMLTKEWEDSSKIFLTEYSNTLKNI